MDNATAHNHYRVVGIRPWASAGTDAVPESLRTFFENREGDVDDLRALATSFGAQLESIVQAAARHQATLAWQGQKYDLDLDPIR